MSMKRQIYGLLAAIICLAASCQKDPDQYPDEPLLYYQSTSPRIVLNQDTASNIRIELKFTDGDGDIGMDPSENTMGIFLKDSRDTSSADFSYPHPFPYIPDNVRPKKGGLEGGIMLNLGRQYFTRFIDSLHLALRRDTMRFNIYIQDIAGNKSNVVTTDTIYIQLD